MALVNISLIWSTFMAITYAAIGARETQDASTRRLRARAETDGLTGLATRALLDRRAKLALESSDEHGTALLILDIDFLKALNDDRGHMAGDALLRHVAQLVSSSIRPADTACRLGGDEIAVLMPGVSSQDAQTRGAALFELVRGSRATVPDGADVHVRLSAGLGHVRSTGPVTQSQLYTVADRALYRAKRQGRGNMCAEAVLLQTLPGDMASTFEAHHGP
jgi:diguanylate cyclase (GGDEF)-like protein